MFRRIFYVFGGGNALFIGSTNLYNTMNLIVDVNNATDRSPAANMTSWVLFGSFFGGISLGKSAYFSALGPVGTYRISLAYLNYRKTGDKKWMEVLTDPGSSMKPYSNPYIIKPFGEASWIPLNK